MEDKKSWMLLWRSFPGWGTECVSLVFGYKCSQYIKQRQWSTKVNMLQLTVRYLNATINRKIWKQEPEIETDGSSRTWQNLRVDGDGSGVGPPSSSGSGCWTGLEPNRTIILVQTRTAGRLPRPVANTTPGISESQPHLITRNHIAQTWWTRNKASASAAIEYLLQWTRLAFDWQIGRAFSNRTPSSWYWCSNALWIVLRTACITELGLSGSRISSPSSTVSWTSLAPLFVSFSSSIISFSCSNVTWADGLLLLRTWNALQC